MKFRAAGLVALFVGCLFMVASMVHAEIPGSSVFDGFLFWPDFQNHLPISFFTKQVTTTPRGTHGSMNTVPDNSWIRAAAKKALKSRPNANSEIVQLGKNLFNDPNLSQPAGQSCASCHSPSAGFTYPESDQNLAAGEVEGAIAGRFGNRIPPSVTYAMFSPTTGPVYDPNLTAYAGGLFWDGRTNDLTTQPSFPLFNPNEMNNIVHNASDPALVVATVEQAKYAKQFTDVFGAGAFSNSAQTNLGYISQAIAAYESSTAVSAFSSKYDRYIAGSATLSNAEMNGLRLFTGSTTGRPGGPANYKFAQCSLCHGIPSDPSTGPDVFSNFCYSNIGVPKNPNNPFYTNTDKKSNPLGYNPDGKNYIDLGLGDYLYPTMGLSSGNKGKGGNGQGDFLAINGTFKAPSLRNVNKRPNPSFVRAYMHNGYFKSLEDVVHFYNTRNLTTVPGEIIDFTKKNPYAHLQGTPLFPAPEHPSPITLQNPSGDIGSQAAQVGNLGLTPKEEADIVAFLKTLTDN